MPLHIGCPLACLSASPSLAISVDVIITSVALALWMGVPLWKPLVHVRVQRQVVEAWEPRHDWGEDPPIASSWQLPPQDTKQVGCHTVTNSNSLCEGSCS